jgi:uncharacterized membrane protein YhaH (DUF805 family)
MATQFAWLFLSFKGRINRQEFWLGYIFVLAAQVLVLIPRLTDLSLAILEPKGRPWYGDELERAMFLPGIVASLITLWPFTALYIKRLRDVGLSGWGILGLFVVFCIVAAVLKAGFVPLLLLAIVGFVPGRRSLNRIDAS